MTTDFTQPTPPPPPPSGFSPAPMAGTPPPTSSGGCLKTGCLVVVGLIVVMFLTAAVTAYSIKRKLKGEPFPVIELTQSESSELDKKMEALRVHHEAKKSGEVEKDAPSPAGAERFFRLTDREINALIAKDPEIADKLRVDFVKGGIKVSIRIPVPKEAPFLGGTTIQGSGEATVTIDKETVDIRLTDVRFAGFSLPKAWLKDALGKNMALDIASEADLKKFAAGIERFQITPEAIEILLAE